ncbi:hypothetical protein PS723_06492 [Pseudomonas fluorescens]|uniref:Uncharacterized protein n=1 Tax=Pseudomonas fluorescens TaxID=294 RepID=A0A5E7FZ41_PSEFL|nr:hypothetical protein PS723_06492 [Pseudomonas fluorescens]
MFASIEDLSTGCGGLLPGTEYFDDQTVLQHQAATGIERVGSENGQGGF